jgi:SAM-dependent methyltransferase
MEKKQWFETWFDSPYYHVLYNHRNHGEAEAFIKALIEELNPNTNATFLDLACGAGRHSKFINSLGFRVTGADLSPNSIKAAQESTTESLDFIVHDMRTPVKGKVYDYIFNLFTSFGYFDNHTDNLRVLKSMKSELTSNGTIVIDFMNTNQVVENIVTHEVITKKDIPFTIQKEVVNGIISKKISFQDKGLNYNFEEKVQALYLKDFEELCNQAGFSIVKAFGNYSLDEFNKDSSDRLIMVIK